MVESASDDILKGADKVDIAFLVVGDPFGQVTLLGYDDVLSLTVTQSDNSHRPHPSRPGIDNTNEINTECLHSQRYRCHGFTTVQFRPDRLHGVLHRDLEAGEFL